jgi:hypothetical protein
MITSSGKPWKMEAVLRTGKSWNYFGCFPPEYYLHEIVETDRFLTILSHLD